MSFFDRQQPPEPLEIPISPAGTSLDLLRAIYRNSEVPLSIRIRCAMACLPFENPKLAVTYQASEHDFATLLDQRIAKYQQAKLIEATPIKENGGNADARMPPSIPDRRFRRRF
jgi:hypothetical protein